ncbi:hypothetical protein I622_14293 [Listeria monocytogenes SHL013]|nr:hypothetical protein I622_14293 [Listeria monocytogenes SHL013]
MSGKSKKEKSTRLRLLSTENHLNRNFQASQPLEKLTTDITYLYFGDCRLYLSSIMDLYNGEIVAYSIGEKQDIFFFRISARYIKSVVPSRRKFTS